MHIYDNYMFFQQVYYATEMFIFSYHDSLVFIAGLCYNFLLNFEPGLLNIFLFINRIFFCTLLHLLFVSYLFLWWFHREKFKYEKNMQQKIHVREKYLFTAL